MGTATDPYQPIEGHTGPRGACLEVLAARERVPPTRPTVVRDIDVLKQATACAIAGPSSIPLLTKVGPALVRRRFAHSASGPAINLRCSMTAFWSALVPGTRGTPIVELNTAQRDAWRQVRGHCVARSNQARALCVSRGVSISAEARLCVRAPASLMIIKVDGEILADRTGAEGPGPACPVVRRPRRQAQGVARKVARGNPRATTKVERRVFDNGGGPPHARPARSKTRYPRWRLKPARPAGPASAATRSLVGVARKQPIRPRP